MLQTFNVAGVATNKEGKIKIKYANNLQSRKKILEKDGYENIYFVQFKNRMTKFALMELLLTHPQFQGSDSISLNSWRQAVLEEFKRLGDIQDKRDIALTLSLGVDEPKLVANSLMVVM
jgi:hypothetical protein